MSSSISLFLVPPKEDNKTSEYYANFLKTILEAPEISPYTSMSKLTSYTTYDNTTLYEIIISSKSFSEFKKKMEKVSPKTKLISSSKIRFLIIQKVPIYVPIIDIFTLITQQFGEVKNVIQVHHPYIQGVNKGIYLAEFSTHEKAMEALEGINKKKKLKLLGKTIEAFIAEPLQNNVQNILMKDIRVLSFNNLDIKSVNAMEFKAHIEHYIDNYSQNNYYSNNTVDNKPIKIKSITQFTSSIVIEFDNFPKCFEIFFNPNLQIDDSYFTYNNVNVPIKAIIKPNINYGKYKDKEIKASILNISPENQSNITNQIFNKNLSNDLDLKSKANSLFNKIEQEEKRTKAKEESRLRKREREKDLDYKRDERNYIIRKEEERRLELEKDRIKDKFRKDKYKESVLSQERDNRRSSSLNDRNSKRSRFDSPSGQSNDRNSTQNNSLKLNENIADNLQILNLLFNPNINLKKILTGLNTLTQVSKSKGNENTQQNDSDLINQMQSNPYDQQQNMININNSSIPINSINTGMFPNVAIPQNIGLSFIPNMFVPVSQPQAKIHGMNDMDNQNNLGGVQCPDGFNQLLELNKYLNVNANFSNDLNQNYIANSNMDPSRLQTMFNAGIPQQYNIPLNLGNNLMLNNLQLQSLQEKAGQFQGQFDKQKGNNK